MKNKSERGFSLIELLIVVVVIGIIASVAVPHLQKAIRGAQIGTTLATMRTISSGEISFFTQNSRFARLNEINPGNSMGTQSGNDIIRSKFVISMTPAVPTDAELQNGYTIIATRDVPSEGVVYAYEMTQSGRIRQILPDPEP